MVALIDDFKVDLVAENIDIDHTNLNLVTELIGLAVFARRTFWRDLYSYQSSLRELMNEPLNATLTNFNEEAITLHTTDTAFHLLADERLC